MTTYTKFDMMQAYIAGMQAMLEAYKNDIVGQLPSASDFLLAYDKAKDEPVGVKVVESGLFGIRMAARRAAKDHE